MTVPVAVYNQLKEAYGLSKELHALKDQQIDQLKDEAQELRKQLALKDQMIEMLKKAAKL